MTPRGSRYSDRAGGSVQSWNDSALDSSDVRTIQFFSHRPHRDAVPFPPVLQASPVDSCTLALPCSNILTMQHGYQSCMHTTSYKMGLRPYQQGPYQQLFQKYSGCQLHGPVDSRPDSSGEPNLATPRGRTPDIVPTTSGWIKPSYVGSKQCQCEVGPSFGYRPPQIHGEHLPSLEDRKSVV